MKQCTPGRCGEDHGARCFNAGRCLRGSGKAAKRPKQPTRWRVVYGETIPAWEKVFDSKRAANAFARKHESFGDIIFSIKRVVASEPPQSLTSAIAAAKRA